jgi:hypothetical protein
MSTHQDRAAVTLQNGFDVNFPPTRNKDVTHREDLAGSMGTPLRRDMKFASYQNPVVQPTTELFLRGGQQ